MQETPENEHVLSFTINQKLEELLPREHSNTVSKSLQVSGIRQFFSLHNFNQEKITTFHQLKESGRSINENLNNSNAFKNPAILEKLITFCNIVETGSNYPYELFDPSNLPKSDYYDALGENL